MNRRRFARTIAAGAAAPAAFAVSTPGTAAPATGAQERPTVRMHVGCQGYAPTDSNLSFFVRHGVTHIDGGYPTFTPGTGWKRDELLAIRDRCGQHGVSLEMYHLPLGSAGIDNSPMPNILLGRSPGRDREIEDIVRIIESSAEAGVRGLNYNMTILPVLRSGTKPGRGGSRYSTWNRAEAGSPPLTGAGRVSRDEFFERIAYFIERVIPAAEANRVQMACHIADPGTNGPWRGVDRALGTVEGLERFMALSDSPWHGFNFCIGSCASGMVDPQGVYGVLDRFGRRGKLFNIHFRNIVGSRDNFMEVYPDNGDLDMVRLMRVLRDVGYPYMIMPDHMPQHEDDPGGRQAFAFGYGFISALIQAVSTEA